MLYNSYGNAITNGYLRGKGDRGDVGRGVLCDLGSLRDLGRDEDFYGDSHGSSLESSDNHITKGQARCNKCDCC